MNDLQKILKNYKDLGLELGFKSNGDTKKLKLIQLIEVRSVNSWEIVYEITENSCNVLEFNYENECPEQSNKTVDTFEEALEIASQWC